MHITLQEIYGRSSIEDFDRRSSVLLENRVMRKIWRNVVLTNTEISICKHNETVLFEKGAVWLNLSKS